MIYYTADLHIGHENILKLSNRPFSTIEEMNETLVINWNSVVTDSDDVYICGDMFYRSVEEPKKYLERMKGKKHLIRGNHDKWLKDESNHKYFEEITYYKEISDMGNRVILFHYPILEWNAYFRGSYHIFGHIHNNTDNDTFIALKRLERALNAGVDANNFFPVTLEKLIVNNGV